MKKLFRALKLFLKYANAQCSKCKYYDPYADIKTNWKCWKCGNINAGQDDLTIGEMEEKSNDVFIIIDMILQDYDLFPNTSVDERRNKTIREFRDAVKEGPGWDEICEHVPLTEEFVEYFDDDDVDWFWIFEQQGRIVNKKMVDKYRKRFLDAEIPAEILDMVDA